MWKALRWPIRIVATLAILFVLYVNIRLLETPVCDPAGADFAPVDVVKQLHFLKKALHEEKAAEDMQLLYPEGFVFLHALYALTWCEVVENLPFESVGWQEGLGEIAFSVDALDSPAARSVFNPDLPLAYGAFYRGWSAYVRGNFLAVQTPQMRDSAVVRQFQGECQSIARAISGTAQPYLESYRHLAWPADNIVCLAALDWHDRMFEPRFQDVRTEWLRRIKNNLDPGLHLIPHGYDLEREKPLEGVRGSSQSLMLVFLADIDSAFAADQYRKYRDHFLTSRLGMPGVREYPRGQSGLGDVDSGPVIAGIGAAASIVGLKTALRFGDRETATGLYLGLNALLLARSDKDEKYCLFGQLPMADAFLAWSSTQICPAFTRQTNNHPVETLLYSLLIVAINVFLIWKTRF